jgi:hypothetical protein
MKAIYFFFIILPGFLQAQFITGDWRPKEGLGSITLAPYSGPPAGNSLTPYSGSLLRPSFIVNDALTRRVVTVDTTIIYKGIDTVHQHVWLEDQKTDEQEFICDICLKNFTVKTTITYIDSFQEAKKRMCKKAGIKYINPPSTLPWTITQPAWNITPL